MCLCNVTQSWKRENLCKIECTSCRWTPVRHVACWGCMDVHISDLRTYQWLTYILSLVQIFAVWQAMHSKYLRQWRSTSSAHMHRPFPIHVQMCWYGQPHMSPVSSIWHCVQVCSYRPCATPNKGCRHLHTWKIRLPARIPYVQETK